MTRTPQVIVFGAAVSSWRRRIFFRENLLQRLRPQRRVRGSRRLSGLLYEHKRLPRNLVLTVRFKTFLPIDPVLRETDEFKLFWPEYRSMADRLGIEKESLLDVLPCYWSHLLSVDNIMRHVAYRLDGKQQGPVDAATMDNMDVIHADGSMAFSKEHSESFRTILLSRASPTCFPARIPSIRIPNSARPR